MLYEIRDLVERLIREGGKSPLAEELPSEREVLDVQTTGCITYRLVRLLAGGRQNALQIHRQESEVHRN